ncbi:hypothetical protein JXL83_07950 [candidate division WOR-3 bacterium]|nr:hypothetical protein [candidate division WOR-3 bacterium]
MRILKLSLIFVTVAVHCLFSERIKICFTSDVQGSYLPSEATWISSSFPPPLGGAASLSGFCALEKPDLLLDAGNFWGLSPLGSTGKIKAGIFASNKIGYDAMSVGIDDLFKGVEFLKILSPGLSCGFISSSILDSSGNFVFDPYRIYDINGVRIGVTGHVSSHAEWFLPQGILNEYKILDESTAVERSVEELLLNDCDIVISLSHSSFRHDTLLANAVSGIDIIIGGFDGFAGTWESFVNHTLNFRVHTDMSSVGLIDIEIDENGGIKNWNFREINLFTEAYNPDEDMLESLRVFIGNSDSR